MSIKKIIKFTVLFILIVVSCVGIFPRKKNLVNTDWKLNPDNKTIYFSVVSPEFKSYIQSAGLPFVFKTNSYNLHIFNLNSNYDISYSLVFAENDPILPYLEKTIGNYSTSSMTIDGHPSFVIKAGKNYNIKNIPSNIPILNKYGSLSSCGFGSVTDNCGNDLDLDEWTALSEKNIQVIASPNVNKISFFIQFILIGIFWMVIINNFCEFFKKKNLAPTETPK